TRGSRRSAAMSKLEERNLETGPIRPTLDSRGADLTPRFARVLRGYGPLVAFVVLFALMAFLLPTTLRNSSNNSLDSGATGGLANEPLPTGGTSGAQGTKGQAAVAGTKGSSQTVAALPPA